MELIFSCISIPYKVGIFRNMLTMSFELVCSVFQYVKDGYEHLVIFKSWETWLGVFFYYFLFCILVLERC